MKKVEGAWIAAVWLAVMLAGAVSVGAQEPPPGPRHRGFPPRGGPGPEDRGPRRPPDPTFSFVGSEMRLGGKVVKGAPYSAVAITETIQTLSNGGRITRTSTAAIYRDGEGRTRTEQTLSAIGPYSPAGEAPQMTFIQDPVAGAHFVLDARNKTAQKMKDWQGPRPENRPPSSSDATTESLGVRVIEGVQAEGTRSTITIPVGEIGNDRPIDIVSERWYSPELQVVVLSKHSDPRMGEHTYRLTKINRSEPSRSLFEVPADYTLTERSFDRGPGPRGMKKRDDLD